MTHSFYFITVLLNVCKQIENCCFHVFEETIFLCKSIKFAFQTEWLEFDLASLNFIKVCNLSLILIRIFSDVFSRFPVLINIKTSVLKTRRTKFSTNLQIIVKFLQFSLCLKSVALKRGIRGSEVDNPILRYKFANSNICNLY